MLTLQAALAQPLTVPEALASLTSGNAFAEFQEQEKGTIARGQLADLVVLSDDLFSMPAAPIKERPRADDDHRRPGRASA